MNPFGTKPKRIRTKKTIEEKLNDLAGKALLEAMRKDPEVLRQYVMKQYGIDIRTPGERAISQVVGQTKFRVIAKAADDISEDPEVQEAMRDKLVGELIGVSPHQHKAREESSQPRGNYHSQMDKILNDINKLEQLKERLGVNNNGLSKLLQNPDVIKFGLGIFQGLMSSLGLTPVTTTAGGNGQKFAMEKDGKLIEVDHNTYMQCLSQQKVLESPGATPIQSDPKEPIDKPVAAKGNPKPWLPPIASSAKIPEPDKKNVEEVITQPTSAQRNTVDGGSSNPVVRTPR